MNIIEPKNGDRDRALAQRQGLIAIIAALSELEFASCNFTSLFTLRQSSSNRTPY
jgi:hypothetical protein